MWHSLAIVEYCSLSNNRLTVKSFENDGIGIKQLTKLVHVDLSGNNLKLYKRASAEVIIPIFDAMPVLASFSCADVDLHASARYERNHAMFC